MGWMDTGIAKTRAAASDARADLAETNSKLSSAEAWLSVTTAGDTAVRKLAGTWPAQQSVMAPLVEVATVQTRALHSRAQATVDALQAERQAAASRLSLAEKSDRALTKLASETDKLLG